MPNDINTIDKLLDSAATQAGRGNHKAAYALAEVARLRLDVLIYVATTPPDASS